MSETVTDCLFFVLLQAVKECKNMENLVAKIKDLALSYGAKELFTISELTVYENDRIGIIGKNGVGKSSLLKLLADVTHNETGQIETYIPFSYYEQCKKQAIIHSELDWTLLSRFHVPKKSEQMSGGEAAKLRLTHTLSKYRQGLLLDEPTTHLDQAGVDLLISELHYYYGTLITVSHNRYFLDQLVTKIWEIADGKLTEYTGNYTDYLNQKKAEANSRKNAAKNYQKEKRQLEKAIIQKRQQADKITKTSAKQRKRNIKPDRLAASKQKDTIQKNAHKTAKALQSRLERLEEVKTTGKIRPIHFPLPKSLAIYNPYPIRGEKVTCLRGDKILLKDVDFQFANGEKIAIIGKNGSGKSSLLHQIVTGGQGIVISPKVKFAMYQQLDYMFTSSETILQYMLNQSDFSESVVRSILNNLGFTQIELEKKINNLSGGEATRVALALTFIVPSNVLILDEPTNFVDFNTIEALQKLIKEYPATVLFTSHDHYFVDNVATQVFEIENQAMQKRR